MNVSFDLGERQEIPAPIVEAAARAMAGLSWIDNLVDRHWDQIEQRERDYWIRFAKVGLIGMALEVQRQKSAIVGSGR